MAGHMGCARATVWSLQVYKVNTKHNVVFVRGSVAGHRGDYVEIRDALYSPFPLSLFARSRCLIRDPKTRETRISTPVPDGAA
jgi:hypothetical protein